ncbi:hypothetical protein [Helicobacter sp. 13S00477-4]|uniref:hypothetical protein n=1 Tax=Helicobacter sp. 13S00477-4 TaxID=1905759 RepID=UPI000BA71ACF|nr:hypothetical protein [Helicobacter sp. 13S00477-4]PAF50808.1 hypothetical protein BKH44_06550 [Helicobacter sp. 13S00477-4]
MKVFLKVLLAALIGYIWYYIGGDNSSIVALVLFVFLLCVLLLKPIDFQSPEKREDYIQQIRKKRERRLALETKQKEEQLQLYKANKEREERKRRELHHKFKNY